MKLDIIVKNLDRINGVTTCEYLAQEVIIAKNHHHIRLHVQQVHIIQMNVARGSMLVPIVLVEPLVMD